MGFTVNDTIGKPKKYIIALAPHTSNWDFIMGVLYSHAEGFQCGFLMKKEWFFWPLGPIFRSLGGIPVYRDKKTSMTDAIAKTAIESETFGLCITPEGTRRRVSDWKKGFYYIALKAQLPILLFGLDYERKLIECTRMVEPTGDYEKEIVEIKKYFEPYKGKNPELFTTGL